jgi:hypothetical protein
VVVGLVQWVVALELQEQLAEQVELVELLL